MGVGCGHWYTISKPTRIFKLVSSALAVLSIESDFLLDRVLADRPLNADQAWSGHLISVRSIVVGVCALQYKSDRDGGLPRALAPRWCSSAV